MSRCRECHYGYHVLCERPDCECRCLPNMHNRKIAEEADETPPTSPPDDFQCSSLHGDDRTRVPHWHVVYDEEADR